MFPAVITSVETFDVRFPTSRLLDGSDAMNPDPDYSAAYVVIGTDAADGLEGHGFAFTIGRGNDVQVAAIRALEPFVIGQPVGTIGDMWRRLVHDFSGYLVDARPSAHENSRSSSFGGDALRYV